jgi:hypothetical protein
MNKIFTFSFVSAKLAYLVCFSIMGMMGNMDMAQAMPTDNPCHEMEMAETPDMQNNCSACTDSEKLWSQDLVFENNDTVIQAVAPAILPMAWDVDAFQPIEIVNRESIPDPPDIAFYASPLRSQTGIVLLN